MLFVRFGWKVRAGITVLILVGYWLAMAFVPVPDAGGAGPFTLEGNLVGYIDRLFLPGRLHETVFDPEGLFSTVPAIATAMLGMFTGEWIKLRKEGLTDRKKVLCLVGAGAVLLIVGLLWSLVFPINKKLWTSSFVCVVGAYSVWMFALFFYIIDVLGWRKWTLFFTVIGMNSITIYLAQRFIRFSYTSEAIFGDISSIYFQYAVFKEQFFGLSTSGDNEIRTRDPLLARQVLSQLSYTPIIDFTYLLR